MFRQIIFLIAIVSLMLFVPVVPVMKNVSAHSPNETETIAQQNPSASFKQALGPFGKLLVHLGTNDPPVCHSELRYESLL